MEGLSRGSRIPDVLVFVMGWIVSTFFWTIEHTPIGWRDNFRYVTIASPILRWAAMREASPFSRLGGPRRSSLRSFRSRFVALMGVLLVINLAVVVFPAPYSHLEAVQTMDQHPDRGTRWQSAGSPRRRYSPT
jgi:hypothetical protein